MACGERWSDGALRFALEDYLGAGAILSALRLEGAGELEPEASVCAAAFDASRDHLERHIQECPSGLELRKLGKADDLAHCAQLDRYATPATLHSGNLVAADTVPG